MMSGDPDRRGGPVFTDSCFSAWCEGCRSLRPFPRRGRRICPLCGTRLPYRRPRTPKLVQLALPGMPPETP